MKIKLHPKEDHPQEGEQVFAVNNYTNIIGLLVFKDGNWYRADMVPIVDVDFQWIELTNEDS